MHLFRVSLFSIFFLFALSGCGLISYSNDTSYTDSEGYIAEHVLKKIRKDKTSKKWLVLNLGEPMHHQRGSNHQELMTWEFSKRERKRVNVLFIFNYGKSHSKSAYMHALLERGKVKKHWFDQHQYIDRADLGKNFSSARQTAALAAEQEAEQYPPKEKKKSFWSRIF